MCIAVFGVVQMFMSQLPNLEAAAWSSYIGAITSFTYTLIAFGLSAANGESRKGFGLWVRLRCLNIDS